MNRPFTTLHRQVDPEILRHPVGETPFAERRRTVERMDAYHRACLRGACICVLTIWALVTYVRIA